MTIGSSAIRKVGRQQSQMIITELNVDDRAIVEMCMCEWTDSGGCSHATDNSTSDFPDPVVVPASELVDVSHKLHQQLINLMVNHLYNC